MQKFIPSDVMINSYKALILPHLEYCAPVLVGLSPGLSNKLEFTNQFNIRTLMNLPKSTPYGDLLEIYLRCIKELCSLYLMVLIFSLCALTLMTESSTLDPLRFSCFT